MSDWPNIVGISSKQHHSFPFPLSLQVVVCIFNPIVVVALDMDKDTEINPDLVHEIIVEEERMSNPYTEVGTMVEKLRELKPHLIEIAQLEDGYTTYMETRKATGIFTARQSRVLGTLGLHEDELDQPLLPALVVQDTSSPMPGGKYFNMVSATKNWTGPTFGTDGEKRQLWEEHVQEVREFWGDS